MGIIYESLFCNTSIVMDASEHFSCARRLRIYNTNLRGYQPCARCSPAHAISQLLLGALPEVHGACCLCDWRPWQYGHHTYSARLPRHEHCSWHVRVGPQP